MDHMAAPNSNDRQPPTAADDVMEDDTQMADEYRQLTIVCERLQCDDEANEQQTNRIDCTLLTRSHPHPSIAHSEVRNANRLIPVPRSTLASWLSPVLIPLHLSCLCAQFGLRCVLLRHYLLQQQTLQSRALPASTAAAAIQSALLDSLRCAHSVCAYSSARTLAILVTRQMHINASAPSLSSQSTAWHLPSLLSRFGLVASTRAAVRSSGSAMVPPSQAAEVSSERLTSGATAVAFLTQLQRQVRPSTTSAEFRLDASSTAATQHEVTMQYLQHVLPFLDSLCESFDDQVGAMTLVDGR
jgi:hypothetical protein